MGVIIIFILFFLFYLLYRGAVSIAKAITGHELKNEVVTGEVKKEGGKFSLKFKDWFIWSAQVNNEKGTAGGNLKINFPIKSAFTLFLICLCLALIAMFTPVMAWVIPGIFLSFAFYHFSKWFSTLRILSQSAKESIKKAGAGISNDLKKFEVFKLTRATQNIVVAGVCKGIQLHYGVPVLIVRLLFLGGPFIFFTSIIYLLLWYFVPKSEI